MCKRILFITAGGALLGALVFGRDVSSYVGTTVGWVRDSVKDNIPVEVEVQRARDMLAKLSPEIRKNMELIAREEVKLEQLEEQIGKRQDSQSDNKVKVMRLKDHLASGDSVFRHAGRSYSNDRVRGDLKHLFTRYKVSEETLENLRKMHTARTKSVHAAREKLEGMLAAREQLKVDIEHLEARMKMIEAAQTTSDYQFDDSQLARIKDLVNDLETRLDVDERMLGVDAYYEETIIFDEPEEENVLDEVTAYFGDREESRQLAATE